MKLAGDKMKLSEAVAIFCNIYNSQESNAEKMEAISIVVENGMPFNSITKQEYVLCSGFLKTTKWMTRRTEYGRTQPQWQRIP